MATIKPCPFCKKDRVGFDWEVFPIIGRVVCRNWQGKCCARGPQVTRFERWDNDKRLRNRAIKAWNKWDE